MKGKRGLRAGAEHPLAVKIKKRLRVPHKKAVAQDDLGRIGKFLAIQPVFTPKIGDAAFGRYPRAAEKYHAAALRNQRPQIVLHACFLRFGMCSFIL